MDNVVDNLNVVDNVKDIVVENVKEIVIKKNNKM
jgi:hypothetical protein